MYCTQCTPPINVLHSLAYYTHQCTPPNLLHSSVYSTKYTPFTNVHVHSPLISVFRSSVYFTLYSTHQCTPLICILYLPVYSTHLCTLFISILHSLVLSSRQCIPLISVFKLVYSPYEYTSVIKVLSLLISLLDSSVYSIHHCTPLSVFHSVYFTMCTVITYAGNDLQWRGIANIHGECELNTITLLFNLCQGYCSVRLGYV